MATPNVLPRIEDTSSTRVGGWIVTVFNNETNTEDQVIGILMKATGCGHEEAVMETWEIHHLGASVVHHGAEEICRDTAAVIATIGIRVEVSEG